MKFIISGDVFLGKKTNIGKEVKKLLAFNDYWIFNFENVFEDINAESRDDKSSILSFSLSDFNSFFNQIQTGNIITTLSNNHIHDLGDSGILNTIRVLNNNNINYLGIHKENEKPDSIILGDNIKIGLISGSTDDFEVMAITNSKMKYNVNDIRKEDFLKKIVDLKKNVDYLIVIPHWGREYMDLPSLQNRKLAHKWIDLGADIVIGHHPHVIQGKEIYKGKNIYYSLGNFIFPDFYNKNGILKKWKKSNCYSISLEVEFTKDQFKIYEHGLYFNTSKNIVNYCDTSISILNSKSEYLSKNITFKKFFMKWEKNYLKVLKKTYSPYKRIISFLTTKHKNHSRIKYMFIRIKKRLKEI
mgnify:CR=1 FL=1